MYSYLNNATAIKISFPGCTTTQLKHYVKPTLEEDKPDIVILCVGTNNFTKKKQSDVQIAQGIIEIVNICQDAGVNEIYVSGIINRPLFQSRVIELNRILEANAETHHYIFMKNSNITESELWKDKLHLNNKGVIILANNFIDKMNRVAIDKNYYEIFF